MPTFKHKNTNMNNKDNMASPKANNLIVKVLKKINLAKTQGKDCKIATMNMSKELKEDMKTKT